MDSPSDDDSTGPRLAFELERIIFEEAARSCFQDVPTLMLTAWRVKHWVEPFLYRVVLSTKRKHETSSYVPFNILLQKIKMTSENVDIVGLSVRYIFTESRGQDVDDLVTALLICPRLVDLYILGLLGDANPALLPGLMTLHNLQRLTIDLKSVFVNQDIDFKSPVFHHLTHLELLGCDSDDYPEALAGLDAVPHLTHIAFNLVEKSAIVHDLIRGYTRLRCIIFMDIGQSNIRPHSADDRFVALRQTQFVDDWLRGATTGEDYWSLAERFIAAKRAGTVECSHYSITADEFSWQS
ncbi:hypothetical protein R3P38DRAFT_898542 [Favolaschia claudopus]|uniref:Uncharacterized protein n=1 Tax=Favolaschia claudopus TaxID=2862362 RepID=A0AAW0BWD0_9AGAR